MNLKTTTLLTSLALSVFAVSGCGITRTLGLKDEGGDGGLNSVGASTLALPLEFPHVVYSLTDASESYWMSSVPVDELIAGKLQNGVIAHVQLLWRPYPGKTPTSSSALNLAVRVLVVSEGKMGLYSGAGFADPSGDAGESLVELIVMGSSLTLVAKTEGFTDLLSPCALTADVAARLSPEDTVRFRRGAAQLLTNALAQPRWVRASPSSEAAVADAVDTQVLLAAFLGAEIVSTSTGLRTR